MVWDDRELAREILEEFSSFSHARKIAYCKDVDSEDHAEISPQLIEQQRAVAYKIDLMKWKRWNERWRRNHGIKRRVNAEGKPWADHRCSLCHQVGHYKTTCSFS